MLRTLSVLFLIIIGGAFAQPAHAAMTEDQKITALLDAFNEPGIVFIRNGEEHDGTWARAHLKEKLDGMKDVKTAEEFIAKVATTSSHTDKPYLVKLKDGKTIESAKWLHEKLAELDKK